jgi:sialate O-acetylesterase
VKKGILWKRVEVWAMRNCVLAAATLALLGSVAHADVTLPKLVSDGMVLQQNKPVRVWGTASPGEVVTVIVHGESATGTAGPDGHWEAMLAPQKAGGPYVMIVKGNNTLTINDVLFGEVWVCSGQSNMEWPLAASFESGNDISSASDSQLRMFTVAKATSGEPLSDVSGAWEAASPKTAGHFSAVGYYFAKKMRKELNVPVGVIHTSWGGTRIEAWTSPEINLKLGVGPNEFAQPTRDPKTKLRLEKLAKRWKDAGSPGGAGTDSGRTAATKDWESQSFDDSTWDSVKVPGEWDTLGNPTLEFIDGVVWFRKTITVPAAMVGKEVTLSLGAIDDTDTAYINGIKVGEMDASVPNVWMAPRNYTVPAGVLKPGKNLIAVRIFDGQGGGGFTSKPEELKLGNLSLAGNWKFSGERIVPASPSTLTGGNPNAASALYHAMLVPVANYTVSGALWYQGESNTGNPKKYRDQMPAMIEDWRRVFQNPELAFYQSQLAPFGNGNRNNLEYAELREAQTLAGKKLKNVGAAVITDIGNETDIHPTKKGPVGERLALLALRDVYKKKIIAQGPTYKKAQFKGNKALVAFDNIGSGLSIKGGSISENAVSETQLLGFELAGADGKFYPAEAKISGKNQVEVVCAQVAEARAVRYAFRNFPIANFGNQNNLPAEPFRSDR